MLPSVGYSSASPISSKSVVPFKTAQVLNGRDFEYLLSNAPPAIKRILEKMPDYQSLFDSLPIEQLNASLEGLGISLSSDSSGKALTSKNPHSFLEIMQGVVQFKLQKELELFKVTTEEELYEKKREISYLKNEATKLYLTSPEGIEQMRKLRETMIRASESTDIEEDLIVSKRYWDLIASNPDGVNMHREIESEFIFTFIDSISLFSEKYKPEPSSDKTTAIQIMKTYHTIFQEKYAGLIERKSGAVSEDEGIVLDYLMLRARIEGKVLLKNTIRKAINPFISQKKEHVDRIAEVVKDTTLIILRELEEIRKAKKEQRDLIKTLISFSNLSKNEIEIRKKDLNEDIKPHYQYIETMKDRLKNAEDYVKQREDNLDRPFIEIPITQYEKYVLKFLGLEALEEGGRGLASDVSSFSVGDFLSQIFQETGETIRDFASSVVEYSQLES